MNREDFYSIILSIILAFIIALSVKYIIKVPTVIIDKHDFELDK